MVNKSVYPFIDVCKLSPWHFIRMLSSCKSKTPKISQFQLEWLHDSNWSVRYQTLADTKRHSVSRMYENCSCVLFLCHLDRKQSLVDLFTHSIPYHRHSHTVTSSTLVLRVFVLCDRPFYDFIASLTLSLAMPCHSS